jgi:hypothetical protein
VWAGLGVLRLQMSPGFVFKGGWGWVGVVDALWWCMLCCLIVEQTQSHVLPAA